MIPTLSLERWLAHSLAYPRRGEGIDLPSEVVSAGGYGAVGTPATVVRVLAPGGGFDWGDAGVGAGGAFALTMIGVEGVLAATSRRRRAGVQSEMSANR